MHRRPLFRAWELRRSENQRYIGLIFYRSGAEFSLRYADLDKVFRLTASEHRILMLMLDGLTADELSQRLGSSLDTVRTHIRNIYGKLKVTSREGMFSRLRPYRV